MEYFLMLEQTHTKLCTRSHLSWKNPRSTTHTDIYIHFSSATALFMKIIPKRGARKREHWYPCLTTRLICIFNENKTCAPFFYTPRVIHNINTSFFQSKKKITFHRACYLWQGAQLMHHSKTEHYIFILTMVYDATKWSYFTLDLQISWSSQLKSEEMTL